MQNQEIVDGIARLPRLQLDSMDCAGSGANAQVYRYRIANHRVAVKCFRNYEAAERERIILEEIRKFTFNCPGIVEYYGMRQIQIEITGTFQTTYQGYAIFMQECPMDLCKYVNQIQHLSPKQVCEFLSQISVALTCMHANGCVHGDLKPQNIMVNQRNQKLIYYLTDFGESRALGSQIAINYQTHSVRGTPTYFSPELWQIYISRATHGRYGPQQADIYSLGIMAVELLLGPQSIYQLNQARDSEQNFNSALQNLKNQLLQIAEFQQKANLVDMVLKMVSHKPEDRINAFQICQNLIMANSFYLEGIEEKHLETLIRQLILLQSIYFYYIHLFYILSFF